MPNTKTSTIEERLDFLRRREDLWKDKPRNADGTLNLEDRRRLAIAMRYSKLYSSKTYVMDIHVDDLIKMLDNPPKTDGKRPALEQQAIDKFRGPKFFLAWLDEQPQGNCEELWSWLDGSPEAFDQIIAVVASKVPETRD